MLNLKKISIIIIIALIGGLFPAAREARALYRVSDQLSLSHPSSLSDHLIQFRPGRAIPAGSGIVLDFDDNFIFPDDLSFFDFDLAVAAAPSGPFVQRELAATSSAAVEGIVIATTTRMVSVSLSDFGIASGAYVRISIGLQSSYGQPGSRQISNPLVPGSYSVAISASGPAGDFLEGANALVAIIEPVSMSAASQTRYSGASPVGWLNFGTSETIMSLSTNFPARCRFAQTSDVQYSNMSQSFTYASSSAYYYSHTVILSGLVNGGSYSYYVRCVDESGTRDNINECIYSSASTTPYFSPSGDPILQVECVDYYIPFSISSRAGEGGGSDTGSGDDPDETGSGSSSGGGSGTGSGGGGGGGVGPSPAMYLPYPPLPGAPGVVLAGWAYPDREVVFLKDGVEQGRVLAKADASFGAYIEELEKGVYTFGVWSEDAAKRRSNSFTTTFWLDAGTQSTVSDIILAPTVALRSQTITAGQMLEIFGQSAPGAKVEAWLYPEKTGEVFDYEIVKKEGLAARNGEWSLLLDTKSLTDGRYLVKARAHISGKGASEFGKALLANIGSAPATKESVCSGADLNGDKKVNLTDFSILLYHWGKSHECADQNHDGTVNLTDFSIMMYHWTG